ncbi:hypothetical protein ZEAMMB73_Zm00001d053557 [Zea mays]|uniref:Uncharacterized protein n=1 Tax=Zea mays TaxID=4577 RepID=A0A1D6QQ26_MAIZE|nr:hypothetical protein ZEAMMB73_Zm00001d053557 [Zea mays]
MWPAATMFALGFLLCPFPALSPSARNLTALLPELRDLFGSLYRHCRQEFVLLASTRRRRRVHGQSRHPLKMLRPRMKVILLVPLNLKCK